MTLNEAIVVRMSHDLAGAVGAFANTVDLMKMDASFIPESVDLLETSSHQLVARLNFFRALFGADTKTITNDLFLKYIQTLAYHVDFEGDCVCRLQLALLAVGLELLGTDGKFVLKDKTLHIYGDSFHCDDLFIQCLMGTQIPCDVKNVMAVWLVHLAQEEGLIIRLNAGENTLILSLT